MSSDGRLYDLAEVEVPQIGWRSHLLGLGELETGLRCDLRAALKALLQTLPPTRPLTHVRPALLVHLPKQFLVL